MKRPKNSRERRRERRRIEAEKWREIAEAQCRHMAEMEREVCAMRGDHGPDHPEVVDDE